MSHKPVTKKGERSQSAKTANPATAYFVRMVDYIPEALIAVDNERKVIGWNTAAQGIYGWAAGEVMGKPLEDFLQTLHVGDSSSEQATSTALESGNWSGEVTQLRKDGTRVPIWSTVSAVTDEEGGVIGFIGINHDISEQKRAGEKIRQSEERFRDTFDQMLEGVQIFDFDWRYLYLNPAAERHNRRPNSELLGNIYMDMWRGIETAPVFSAIERCMNERIPSHIETEFEYPDGSVGWFELNIRPIPEGIFILSVDITERKQAAQALREKESILKIAGEVAQIGSWRWDLRTQKVTWSDEMFRLFGMERESFDGDVKRVVAERVHPDDRAAVSESNRGVLEEAKPTPLSYRIILPDGTERTVWAQGRMIHDEAGKPIALTGYMQDITAQARAEKQLRQMKRLYATLSQVNQTIVRVKKPAELYQSICDVTVKFGEFPLAWVGLLDEKTGDVNPVSASGMELSEWHFPTINTQSRDYRQGITVTAIQSSRVITDADTESAPHVTPMVERLREAGYHSIASVPFRLRGRVIGILMLVSSEKDLFRSEEELRLLDEMGLDISFALDMMEMEKEAAALARFPSENPNPVLRVDRNGRILYANLASAPLLTAWGCEVGQVLPNDWRQRTASVRYPAAAMEFEMDCGGRIFSCSIAPVEAEEYVNIYARDITGHKQAQEALRLENERFLQFANSNIVGIVIAEANGKVPFANDYYLNLLGLTRQDFEEGKVDWRKFTPPEWLSADEKALCELQERGVCEPYEKEYIRADGSRVAVYIADAMLPGPSGQIAAFVIDITERKKAEEALEQSEERYRQTLDQMMEGCQIIGFDWRYIYVNDAAARHGKTTREALLNHTMMEAYPGIEDTKLFSALRDCMENRTSRSLENIFTYPDGTSGYFELNIQPAAEGLFVLSIDITERKQAENQIQVQLKRMRALNEIDRAISSSLDMRLSLEILLEKVLAQLEVDAASVLLLNPTSQTLEYEAGKGFRSLAIRETRMRLGEGLAGQAGVERKAIHCADLAAIGDTFLRQKLLKKEGFVEYFGVPLVAKGMLKGVLEIFHRSPLNTNVEWLDYLETLGGQAAIAIDNAQLFEGMQVSNLELITAYDATIEGWSRAMDLRDKETEGHTLRVTETTVKLAKKMGISQQEITHMRRGALLHDIGKLGVPDHILHKPDKLDKIEWAIMRQHPTYAFNMLMPIHYLRPALDIPYCHHEKWDGTGYPRGLKGGEIPFAARIFAIVDVWDALRSNRPYRAAWTAEQVRQLIVEESGTHFDPQVAQAFLELLDEDPSLQ